jgi:hypothetical protein
MKLSWKKNDSSRGTKPKAKNRERDNPFLPTLPFTPDGLITFFADGMEPAAVSPVHSRKTKTNTRNEIKTKAKGMR